MVLITDLPEVMDLLTANASKHQRSRAASPEANGSPCGEIACQSFDWSQDPSLQNIPLSCDLCIFSECLYDDDIFGWLRDALLKVPNIVEYVVHVAAYMAATCTAHIFTTMQDTLTARYR